MITLAKPTQAIEFGTPLDPHGLGRWVILFAGMQGTISRDAIQPTICAIFTVAQSGARYLITLTDVPS